MSPYITVQRPDGSKLQVTEEQANRLETLGYRRQTEEERAVAAGEAAKTERLTTPGQKALTALEGFGSGASLGITDLLGITAGGESNERAAANPGYRLASELVGGVAPALVGGSVLRATPAGLVAEGAEAATAGIESTTVRRAVQTGIEGAIQGAGSGITHAQLTDEPLSVESVVQSAGWGALFGFGLGGGLGKLEGTGQRMAVRVAAEKAERDAAQALAAAPETFGAFRGAVDDLVKEAEGATKAVNEQLEGIRKADFEASRAPGPAAPVRGAATVEEQMAEASARRNLTPPERLATEEPMAAWKRVEAEARVGNPKGLREAIDAWKDTIRGPYDQLATAGPPPLRPAGLPDVAPVADAASADRVLRADKAMKTAADLVSIQEALKNVPRDLKGFLRMKPEAAENTFAALEKALSNNGVSEQVRKSLGDQINSLAASAGIATEQGTAGTVARATWDALRTATSNKNLSALAKLSTEPTEKVGLLGSILKRAASFHGYNVGKKVAGRFGMGSFMTGVMGGAGSRAAEGLVSSVLGLKAMTALRLRNAVARWGPGFARTARPIAGKAASMKGRWGGDDPLRIRLDGSYDDTKDDREAAVNRLTETAGFTPAARDTLYRTAATVQAEGHPDFAAALHRFTVGAFELLFGKMPKDPGTVIRGGKSQWRYDEVQVEQLRRALEIFHDPVGAIERMVQHGHVSPDQVALLDEMWPATLQEARTAVYERLAADPDWLPNQDIDVQSAVGTFLGTPVHSSMRPEFVAAQMAMFANRQQPRPQSEAYPDSGGRPPGPDKNTMATQAQRITEH